MLRIQEQPHAEASADIGKDYPNARCWQVKYLYQPVPQDVTPWLLLVRVSRHPDAGIIRAQGRTRLQGDGGEPIVDEIERDHAGGLPTPGPHRPLPHLPAPSRTAGWPSTLS